MDREILARIENRWDTHAKQYDERHGANEDLAAWTGVLKKLLGPDTAQTVLDVGTGTGFLALLTAEIGYPTTGADTSEGMMELARQHAAEKGVPLELVKCLVEEIPAENNSWDIIVNRHLMWTLTRPEKALEEWKRVLKPGGRLFCFCTVRKGPMMGNHYDQDIEDILPLKGADEKQLAAALEAAGFVDVEPLPLLELPLIHVDTPPAPGNCWYAVKGRKPA